MKSSIWTGCALVLALGGVVAARENHHSPVASAQDPDASAACHREKGELEGKRRKYLSLHPAVVHAEARAQAACRPAPTADCAVARADLADARLKYLDRHPALISAHTRAETLCAPAPNPACARARADLAEAKARFLEKHPRLLAASQAAEQHCGPAAAKTSKAPEPEPEVTDSERAQCSAAWQLFRRELDAATSGCSSNDDCEAFGTCHAVTTPNASRLWKLKSKAQDACVRAPGPRDEIECASRGLQCHRGRCVRF
jgi:hypothetical protein